MQKGDRWTGSCWCREVIASVGLVVVGSGRGSLIQEGSCCCREVVAGAGSGRAVSEVIRLDFQNWT